MSSSEQNWREQKERSSQLMNTILVKLALLFGRNFIRLLLIPIVYYFMLTSKAARTSSRQALARFTDNQEDKITHSQIFNHLYAFAQVTIDRIYLLAGRDHYFDVSTSGTEIFDQFRDQQQGALLFVSHVGSFDVMRVPGVEMADLSIKILMDKGHHNMIMSLINAINPEFAEHIIDAKQSPSQLALSLKEALDNGSFVGIMADRANENEHSLATSFAGSTAYFPTSPWLLAWVLKVPVIMCTGLYLGKNRYSLNFELLNPGLSGSRKERMTIIQKEIDHYSHSLEQQTRKAPYNWFNFYPFWQDNGTHEQ